MLRDLVRERKLDILFLSEMIFVRSSIDNLYVSLVFITSFSVDRMEEVVVWQYFGDGVLIAEL